MDYPRIGISLPTFGPHASGASIVTVAQAAEAVGFHGVSVSERLLLPAGPDWRNDAKLPDTYVWEPLEALAWAAAHTQRVRLASAIINAPFQQPIMLARRLATVDQLSGGRLDVGLGQGWLPEEFAATGVSMSHRAAGFEEHIATMRACWGPDPVEHHGALYQIPISKVGPKPVNGDLPVLIGGLARPAVERAARIGDGFITAVVDWDTSGAEIEWYREAGGSGPILLLPARWYDGPDTSPAAFVDTSLNDLERAADAGVDEVHFGLNLAEVEPRRQVDAIEALAAALAA